jgi:hypothetical protein
MGPFCFLEILRYEGSNSVVPAIATLIILASLWIILTVRG